MKKLIVNNIHLSESCLILPLLFFEFFDCFPVLSNLPLHLLNLGGYRLRHSFSRIRFIFLFITLFHIFFCICHTLLPPLWAPAAHARNHIRGFWSRRSLVKRIEKRTFRNIEHNWRCTRFAYFANAAPANFGAFGTRRARERSWTLWALPAFAAWITLRTDRAPTLVPLNLRGEPQCKEEHLTLNANSIFTFFVRKILSFLAWSPSRDGFCRDCAKNSL